MIYGYVRVSKAEKDRAETLSLDSQARAILTAHPNACEIIREDGVSATIPLMERPSDLARVLREGDRLVAVRLDRVFRNVKDALGQLDELRLRGIAVSFLDLNLDLGLPAGRLMFTMFAAFAEMERNLISQRTREALAERKAQGKHCGRVAAPLPQLDEARAAVAAGERVAIVARRLGIPPSTLRRRLLK